MEEIKNFRENSNGILYKHYGYYPLHTDLLTPLAGSPLSKDKE
jgi:hypothetical protein